MTRVQIGSCIKKEENALQSCWAKAYRIVEDISNIRFQQWFCITKSWWVHQWLVLLNLTVKNFLQQRITVLGTLIFKGVAHERSEVSFPFPTHVRMFKMSDVLSNLVRLTSWPKKAKFQEPVRTDRTRSGYLGQNGAFESQPKQKWSERRNKNDIWDKIQPINLKISLLLFFIFL